MNKKNFSFVSVILSLICVVFVAEAAAPAAAIGNQQFFWWIFLIVTFLLPYGMVVAELGTTYESDGGLYDWVRNAFGDKWGSRVAWYYWINFPLWVASLATLFPPIIELIFQAKINLIFAIIIELIFIWVVVVISFNKVSDSAWILNVGAVLKVTIALVVGAVSIWFACNNGFANDMSFRTFIPDLNSTQSFTYISVILFNFMGFEVITTFASDMKNPKKDIPKAIILGGFVIAAIYLFASFGIAVAIPIDQIDPNFGMIIALKTMVGNSPILAIVSITFLITLFANMASWSFGVNSIACYAAKHGNMPKLFSINSKKTGMPNNISIANGVIASLCILLQLVPVESISNGIFWMLFSMNIVFLLISYIPMFPAFVKFRKIDPNRKRIFRFPFKGVFMVVCLAFPVIELILSIVATVIPLNNTEAEISKIPILLSILVFVIIGEIVRLWSARNKKEHFNGLSYQDCEKLLKVEIMERKNK